MRELNLLFGTVCRYALAIVPVSLLWFSAMFLLAGQQPRLQPAAVLEPPPGLNIRGVTPGCTRAQVNARVGENPESDWFLWLGILAPADWPQTQRFGRRSSDGDDGTLIVHYAGPGYRRDEVVEAVSGAPLFRGSLQLPQRTDALRGALGPPDHVTCNRNGVHWIWVRFGVAVRAKVAAGRPAEFDLKRVSADPEWY